MTKSDTSEDNMASYADKTNPKYGTQSNENEETLSSVKPVFMREFDVFGIDSSQMKINKGFLQNDEMFEAVSKVVMNRCIKGLQRIRGLWRIYLDDDIQRDTLIACGLQIRGKSIPIYSRNPRVTSNERFTDIRIRVKDVPLSAQDGQIIRALEEYKCVVIKHFRERLRYQNFLTNCQTGDRIVIVEGPRLQEDIPRSIPIGKYRATIIYRGQPNPNRKQHCTKCLGDDHHISDCQNDWRCKSCGEVGHKQSTCTSGMFSQDENQGENHDVSIASCANGFDASTDDLTQPPTSVNQTDSDMNVYEPPIPSQELDLDHSQSLLAGTTQASDSNTDKNISRQEKGARPKVKANSNSDPPIGQPRITSYVSRTNFTPSKQSTSTGLLKSPVTPTEELHDKEGRDSKKSKNTG